MDKHQRKISAAARKLVPGQSLYAHQVRTGAALLSGRNVMLISPMGSGKSLCYQLITYISAKPTLVISPLIALMDDQVEKTRSLGFSAERLHSGVDAAKQWWSISSWTAGKLQILYTSPERLNDERLRQSLLFKPPGLIVVDEAHCISTWGNRFRPAYRQLGTLLQNFTCIPVLAMTASANPNVQQDIVKSLRLSDCVTITVPFTFSNLALSAHQIPQPQNRLEFVAGLAATANNLPMLVFCVTKKQCEWLSLSLLKAGHDVLTYHSGMTQPDRAAVSANFRQSSRSVLVATSAFELGVDKTDIRTVIHFSLPSSLESYVQGVGRAGRDGAAARSILLYSEQDLDTLDALASHLSQTGASPADSAAAAAEIYAYATSKTCRVLFLNRHFFPETALKTSSPCEFCDSCHTRRSSNASQDPMFTPAASALKLWRRNAAAKRKQSAFTILTDREIRRLLTVWPKTLENLAQIAGIRRTVCENFGQELIEVIHKNTNWCASFLR